MNTPEALALVETALASRTDADGLAAWEAIEKCAPPAGYALTRLMIDGGLHAVVATAPTAIRVLAGLAPYARETFGAPLHRKAITEEQRARILALGEQ